MKQQLDCCLHEEAGALSTNKNIEKVEVLGVQISPLDTNSLNQNIVDYVKQQKHALVIHINVYGLNLARRSPWLKKFYNQANLIICDGIGPIIGARILGQYIPERITYMDWIWELAALAESQNFTMYFLGGKPGIAEKAANYLQNRFPKLKVVGCHHGYFNKEKDSIENAAIVKEINVIRPNLLLVGFGMPRQEQWLLENWSLIDADVALGPGAMFDYLAGDLKRSPKWMTDNGLEWLGRFLIEPRRLWKRYILGNPIFLWHVVLQKFKGIFSIDNLISNERSDIE